MNSQPVEFLPPVEHDLRYAHEFYGSWKLNGAEDFQERFRECASWIAWNPTMFPRHYRTFRRAIIWRSYFAVYYAIDPGLTMVIQCPICAVIQPPSKSCFVGEGLDFFAWNLRPNLCRLGG